MSIKQRFILRRTAIRYALDCSSTKLVDVLDLDQYQVDYRLKVGFTNDELMEIERATCFDRKELLL